MAPHLVIKCEGQMPMLLLAAAAELSDRPRPFSHLATNELLLFCHRRDRAFGPYLIRFLSLRVVHGVPQ